MKKQMKDISGDPSLRSSCSQHPPYTGINITSNSQLSPMKLNSIVILMNNRGVSHRVYDENNFDLLTFTFQMPIARELYSD